jgi:hypothetical protein
MAAGGNPANVDLGPGRLYIAPLGTAEPTSASAALDAAFVAVGYTDAGSMFATTVTNSEVEVAEEVDPIAYVMSKRVSTLAFAMAETTRRNFALAMGGGVTTNSAAPFEAPNPGSEVAIMIIHDSEETPTAATNTRFLFRQAKPGGTVNMNFAKAPAKTLIAVTFNLEKPASATPFIVWNL